MSVSHDITASRATRRARLAELVGREFGADGVAGSHLTALLDGPERVIITSRDIDAITTACILSEVTGWKIGAVLLTGLHTRARLHPDFEALTSVVDAGAFGADVFSTRFPNASNHAIYLGDRAFTAPGAENLSAFHDTLMARLVDVDEGGQFTLNPSAWIGTQAWNRNDLSPQAMRYKYPMGSAQVLLALLESIGRGPVIRDFVYLPWLIANCDGALSSLSVYGFNVEPWWDALAAGAGPGSFTLRIREMVRHAPQEEFSRVVRALHGESSDVASVLTVDWNLTGQAHATLATVVRWIGRLCAWQDPFRPVNGVTDARDAYATHWHDVPLGRGSLKLGGPLLAPRDVARELHRSLNAAYMSLSQRQGVTMDWVMLT